MEKNTEDKLGKEFEDWLDSVELTLPVPVPEKEKESGKNKVDTADIQKTR